MCCPTPPRAGSPSQEVTRTIASWRRIWSGSASKITPPTAPPSAVRPKRAARTRANARRSRRQPITDTQGEHTMATLRRRLPTTTTHSTGTHHPTHTAIHRTPPTPRTHRSRQEPRRTLLRRRRDTSEPIPPPPVRSRSRTNILIPTRLLLPPIRFLEGESAAGRSASSGALKQVRFRGGAHSPAFDGRGRSPVSYCTGARLLNCEHTASADVGVYCAPVRASVCWRLCGPAAPRSR